MIIPGWRAEDGMTGRDVDVATGTALWNSRGITLPVRWVLNPGSGWTRRDAHFRLLRAAEVGIGDPDMVCDAMGE